MRTGLSKLEVMLHFLCAFILALYYKGRIVNIIDLDNTLVPTRKFQKEKGIVNIFGDKNFPKFSPIAKEFFANCEVLAPTFILTARPYRTTISTSMYIQRETNRMLVFICRTANMKLIYLRQLNKYCSEVNYYDDLSHGITEVKLYENLIQEVKVLERIRYFDISFINKHILCD